MCRKKSGKNRKENDKRKTSLKDRVAILESRLDAIVRAVDGQQVASQSPDGSAPAV